MEVWEVHVSGAKIFFFSFFVYFFFGRGVRGEKGLPFFGRLFLGRRRLSWLVWIILEIFRVTFCEDYK